MNYLMRYTAGHHLATRILTAARIVHQCLGVGCPRESYRTAFANTLIQQNLDVQVLFPIDAWQNHELVDLYFPDLFVEWQIIVIVDARQKLFTVQERSELVECLNASGAQMGLLVNFGKRELDYETVLPD